MAATTQALGLDLGSSIPERGSAVELHSGPESESRNVGCWLRAQSAVAAASIGQARYQARARRRSRRGGGAAGQVAKMPCASSLSS